MNKLRVLPIEQAGWILFLKLYDASERRWERSGSFTSIIPEPLRWRNWAKHPPEDLLPFINELFEGLQSLPDTSDRRKSIVRAVFQNLPQPVTDPAVLRRAVEVIHGLSSDECEELFQPLCPPRPLTDFVARHLRPGEDSTITDLAAGACGFLVSILNFRRAAVKKNRIKAGWWLYGVEADPQIYILGAAHLLLHGVSMPKLYLGSPLEPSRQDAFNILVTQPPFEGTEPEDVQGRFPENLRSASSLELYVALATFRLKPSGRAAVVVPENFWKKAGKGLKEHLLTHFNLHTIVTLPKGALPVAASILFFDRGEEGKETGTEQTWHYHLPLPEGYKRFTKTKPLLDEHFAACDAWWDDRKEIEGTAKACSPQELLTGRK